MLHIRCGQAEYEIANRFNGHPPLWVNATIATEIIEDIEDLEFQWAPTLVGECYASHSASLRAQTGLFQWAPTLVGECYTVKIPRGYTHAPYVSMGTHPCG